MNVSNVFIGAVCACIATYVSVHIFLDPAPEYVRVASAQGELVIEGFVYQYQTPALEEYVVPESQIPLTDLRYNLLPEHELFAQPLIASFLPSAEASRLYAWNSVRGYWEVVPSFEQENSYRHAPLFTSGLYAFGVVLSVDTPTFVDVAEGLRARLPDSAVAYSVRLVATPEGGVPVLLDDFLESGGCAGIPQQGLDHLIAQDERVVQVLVNDVLTEVTFDFLMDIETDPRGCSADMPMQAFL